MTACRREHCQGPVRAEYAALELSQGLAQSSADEVDIVGTGRVSRVAQFCAFQNLRRVSSMSAKLPKVGLLAGPEWSYDLTGSVISHINPANGKVQDEVTLAGPSEVDRAVQSARTAFRVWRAMKPSQRRDILGRWTALVKEQLPAHIELAALEGGRPVSQGSDAHEWMAYYTGWADKLDGEVISGNPAAGINYAVPDPYGVVAVITPLNAPVEIAAMTAFPAIAAGTCVVLKPPDVTPYTSVLFASLALEAGL